MRHSVVLVAIVVAATAAANHTTNQDDGHLTSSSAVSVSSCITAGRSRDEQSGTVQICMELAKIFSLHFAHFGKLCVPDILSTKL